jgi:hypothetical protein
MGKRLDEAASHLLPSNYPWDWRRAARPLLALCLHTHSSPALWGKSAGDDRLTSRPADLAQQAASTEHPSPEPREARTTQQGLALGAMSAREV